MPKLSSPSTDATTVPLHGNMKDPDIDYLQLSVGCGYSIGKKREKNQDSLFTFTSGIANNDQRTPFGVYIVADGMGGHELGEVASEMAIRAAADEIIQKLYIPFLNLSENKAPISDVLNAAVSRAHEAVLEKAPEGGTTLTIALITNNHLAIAHIGDSRAYYIKADGQITALTRDHSLVRRLEELGQITSDEAAVHPQRNILYRALGQGEHSEPEIIFLPIPEDGYLLLCSDGLWGVVPEDTIVKCILKSSTPYQACQSLMDAANEGGGPDNISAILIRFLGMKINR